MGSRLGGEEEDFGTEGALLKLSPARFRGWQKRWFVLRGRAISYFKSSSDASAGVKPKGSIPLTQVVALRPFSAKARLGFEINVARRTYVLCAESKDDRERWLQALRMAIAGQVPSSGVVPSQVMAAPRMSLLKMIVEGASLSDISCLIEESSSCVHERGRDGYTPLLLAAREGNESLCGLLLDHGADVDGQLPDGSTALLLACSGQCSTVVSTLLRHDANIGATALGGAHPLFSAAQRGFEGIVRLLLGHGAPVDRPGDCSATALFVAAQAGHIDVVRLLLEAGADPNRPCQRGATPLWAACMSGHLPIVQSLVDSGGKKDLPDQSGVSPLEIARASGHTPIISFLESCP